MSTRGIFERPKGSGIWWISYWDAAGKWHREKVGRRSVALEAYHTRKREIREGRFIAPMDRRAAMPIRALAEAAIAAKVGRRAHLTIVADKFMSKRLFEDFGDARADAIDSGAVEHWLAELHKARSGATVNRYRALLSSVFSYGIRTGKLTVNPVSSVPRYKESAGRIRFLDPAEETALRGAIRAACPEREPELDLALNTGLRRHEQFTLKWENVDFERDIITVTGKTGRRFIPMNATARAALLRIRDGSTTQYVIAQCTHDQQRNFRRWLERALQAAGICNFTWHDLRHTFASRLVMAGVDLRTVQELLGHRNILMTLRYAHLAPAHLKASVDVLCQPQEARSATLAGGEITHTRTTTARPKRLRKAREVQWIQ